MHKKTSSSTFFRYILYKRPNEDKLGLSYFYMDESTNGWILSQENINSDSGTLANTLRPLFDFYDRKVRYYRIYVSLAQWIIWIPFQSCCGVARLSRSKALDTCSTATSLQSSMLLLHRLVTVKVGTTLSQLTRPLSERPKCSKAQFVFLTFYRSCVVGQNVWSLAFTQYTQISSISQ